MYEKVCADDVFVAAGAEEAIFLFFTAVLRRGQAVVVHYPAYQSLFQVRLGKHARVCVCGSEWCMGGVGGGAPVLTRDGASAGGGCGLRGDQVANDTGGQLGARSGVPGEHFAAAQWRWR
jgi:hypothetical protein